MYHPASNFRPTIHTCTTPSWKESFLKTLFKQEEFEKAGFLFFCGQIILKTELYGNNVVTVIKLFPQLSFP